MLLRLRCCRRQRPGNRAFSTEARPQLERTIITDEAEPVWYQIVDRYGDMTITVEADLRVQHAISV